MKRRFKNQKLPGWRPIYGKKWVLPIMLCCGVCFTILAVVLLAVAYTQHETALDYTGLSS